MNKVSPYDLFETKVGQLENYPCSILALGLALKDLNVPVKGDLGVTVDKDGYCQLTNMMVAIKRHISVIRYRYIKPGSRKKLKDYTLFPGKYIVCVKGHYIYVKDTEYYSFFDNSEDEVIAYWLLKGENGND